MTELSTRPILLDMIIKTLPLLKDKTEINAADLYHAYTSEWIERDDWRSCLTSEGKRGKMFEKKFERDSLVIRDLNGNVLKVIEEDNPFLGM